MSDKIIVYIHYAKNHFSKLAIRGAAFLEKKNKLPRMDSQPDATHEQVCSIGITLEQEFDHLQPQHLDKVFSKMNSGQMKLDVPIGRGLDQVGHTSMCVGDVISFNGKSFMVDLQGFRELN